jgi:hypothetical protein
MKKIILQLSIIAICFFQAVAVTAQVTPGSVITDANGDAQLSTWLNNNVSGTLLYRRSVNGASASAFHALCDNQGPTIVVCKTAYGTVFGGYNPNSWNGNLGNYLAGSTAFLFNLTTAKKATTVGGYYSTQQGDNSNQYSTYNYNNYGPTFGGGHDWQIDGSMNAGYINTGFSYTALDGSGWGTTSAAAALAGPGLNGTSYSAGFLTEVEVYKITPGAPGGALNFDGTNDLITIPRNTNLDLSNNLFTIEYWAKPTAVDNAFHWVISKDASNSDLDYLSGLNSDNKWRFVFKNFAFDLSSTTTAVSGTWYHVACTYDGTTARLYINGIQEASATVAVGSVSNASNILLGARTASGANQFFKGDIDEVRIWNRALPDCEVKSTKDCELINPTTQPGLLAYYKFRQGQVNSNNTAITTLTDVSANGYTGTLSGFASTGTTSNWVATKVSGTCDVYAAPTATITASQGTNMCAGGSLPLAANTGTGYSYLWQKDGVTINGANSSTYNVTTAGAYTVIVTNGFGCAPVTSAATTIVIITTPTVEAITGNTNLCINTTSQLADVTPNGVWSSSNSSVASVNSNGLVTGSNQGTATIQYSITPPGCGTITASATVNVYSLPVVAAITGGTKACPSSTIQLANATASGVWSSSNTAVATVNSSGLVSTLTAGTTVISYTVTTNGCSTAKSVTLTIAPITATFTKKASCEGGSTGTATVSGSGGGSGAGGGLYYGVTARQNIGDLVTIDLNTGAATVVLSNLPYAFTAVAVSSTGEIIAASNSYPTNFYKIDPANGQTTFLGGNNGSQCSYIHGLSFDASGTLYAMDLCGGLYTVNTSNGALSQINNSSGGPRSGLQFDPVDGQLWACNTNGIYKMDKNTGAVTYIGSTGFNQVSDIIFDASGNMYGISGGGSGTNQLFSINKTTGQGTAIGYTGVANIAGLGGGGKSYTYLWDNGQTTATATGLSAGVHTVTLTDGNGCTGTASVTITQQAKPTVFNMTGGGAYCQNGNGVQVGLSGSESGINYQLQFNGSNTGGTYQGNGNPIDFGYQYQPGTYTVVASNATIICTQNMNGTAVVVQNPLPDQNVTYNGNNNICPSSTLLLSTSTGSGYTYQWRKDGNDIQGATNATYAAGQSGYYSVAIRTGEGCYGNSFPQVYIDVFPTPIITVSGSTTFCAGGTRTLTSDNGNGKFTGYTWNPGGTSGNSLTVSQSGVYTVTATNGTCTATSAPVTLTATENTLVLATALVTPTSCQNATDGAISLTPSGGTAPYTYGYTYDFSGNAIDNSLFTVTNGNFSQSNGQLYGNGTYNYGWGNAIATKQVFSIAGDVTIEGTFKSPGNNQDFFFGFASTGSITQQNDMRFGIGRLGSYIYAVENSGFNYGLYAPDNNSFYDFKIEKVGSQVKYSYRVAGSGAYNLFYTGNYSQAYTTATAALFTNANGGSSGVIGDDWKITAPVQTTGLSTGIHNYVIYDAAGCSAASSINVIVDPNANPIQLSATATPASCENGTDGTVTLTATHGSGQYSFDQFSYAFSGNSLNTGLLETRNGSFSENGGSLRADPINIYPNNGDWDNSVYAKNIINGTGDFTLSQTFKFDYNYNNGTNVAFGLSSNIATGGPGNFSIGFYYQNGNIYAISNNNTYGTTNNYYVNNNTWYDFKIEKKGTTINYYVRQSTESSYTLVYTYTNFNNASATWRLGAEYTSYYSYYGGFNTKDWKISTNPPTTALAPGNYTYTVTDLQGGCTATTTVTVPVYTGPGALALTASAVTPSCPDGASGSVVLTPSGGSGSYTYAFTHSFAGSSLDNTILLTRNGRFTQNGTLREVAGGNGSWDNALFVKRSFEGSDITAEYSFKFDYVNGNNLVAFGLAENTSITDPSSFKASFRYENGNLYANVNGGSYNGVGISTGTWYDFKIVKTSNSASFYYRTTGGGNYTLLQTISATLPTIVYAGVLNLTYSQYYDSWYGWQYDYNVNAGYESKNWSISANPKTSNLAPGTYTYRVNDTNGCSASTTVTILGTATFEVTAAVTNATATGLCNGSVVLSSSTGGTLYPTTRIISEAFTTTSGVNTTLFEVGNGNFSQSNGDLRSDHLYAYNQWNNYIAARKIITDNGSKIVYQSSFKFENSTEIFFGLYGGSYMYGDYGNFAAAFYYSGGGLYAFVNGGNYYIRNISYGSWYDFKIEKENTTIKYYIRGTGESDFTLIYTANYYGGQNTFRAAAYHYDYYYNSNNGYNSKNWSVSGAAPTSGLCAGTYTYTVASEGGCASNVTFTVTDQASVTLSQQHVNPTCYGSSNGSITLTATSGTAPYSYSMDGETYVSGNVFNNLPAGTYTLYAKDANNVISAAQQVTLTQPAEVTAPTVNVVNNCDGTATLSTSASGTLLWSTNETTPTITVHAANTYTVTQTVNGCTSTAGSGTASPKATPTITGPGNLTANTEEGICSAHVTYATTATGTPAASVSYTFTGATTASGSGNGSGSVFNKGVTNVTVIATNTCGSVSTSFTVTVTDNENPTITAPAAVTAFADNGACTAALANITLGTPVTADNCAVASVTNNAPANFVIGNTTVTWTVTDASGHTATATQTVTVSDNQVPVFNSITNISVSNDEGKCGATVNIVPATATDNCGATTVAGVRSDGLLLTADYPVGTTVITWTATDSHGNPATATQNVTVTDDQHPVVITQNITVELGANGTVTITPAQINNGSTDNCAIATYSLDKITFDCSNRGANTVTLTVTDNHGNQSTATAVVTVEDNILPTITAPANVTANTDNALCAALLAGVNLGTPVTGDNCSVASVTNNAPASFPVGVTTVIWTVTDAKGNTATATQTVTVVDDQRPVIINLPANFSVNALTINCASMVAWTRPTATDNCGIASLVSNDPFFDQFGVTILSVGAHTITYTATDIHGNTTTASFIVTVVDNQAPIITGCPGTITVNATAGTCEKTVIWNPPTASDNCPGVSLTTNHVSGETFPVGTTVVTYTATDNSGLITTCSFNVVVVDAERPTITASDITLNNDANDCGANVTVAAPVTHDNCGVQGVVNDYNGTSNASGHYLAGTTNVTWTVTDIHGNSQTFVQHITVKDVVAPAVPVLATVTGECSATATVATATDNCAGTVNGTTTDPLVYNAQGTYTIHWTFNDGNGNTSTATQTVVVKDVTAPAVPVLATVTGECSATASVATTTDNCAGTVTGTTTDALSYSAQGTYTIHWTFNDGNGNTSTATQTVIVKDVTAPVVPVLATVTGQCSASATAPATTDNCAGSVTGTTTDPLTYNAPGTYTIHWTFNDGNGNTSTATQLITVTAPDINVTGNSVTIVKGDATPSVSDNTDFGGTLPGTPVAKTFTIQNKGTAPLVVSSIGVSGANASEFTVSGISLPVTIAANASANFTLTYLSNNVGISNAVVTVNTNDCNDASYDFAVKAQITCTMPSFANSNPYIQNNTTTTTCNAVVTYPLAANGIPAPSVSYTFTGATTGTGTGTGSGQTFNTGVTHVVVQASNACGTVSNSFDVTVVDNVKPVVITKNVTVFLDGTGHATVNPADINNGSYDNCGPVTLSVQNTGTICATAAEGSSLTLTAPAGTVITAINFASYGTPNGSCGNFTVGGCNASNSLSIVQALALNKSSVTIAASNGVFGDPCGGTVKRLYIQATYSGQVAASNTFDCSKLGNNTVTLIVTDANGNSNSSTATVTVRDAIAPVPNVASLSTINRECSVTVTRPTATDNCTGIVTATTPDPLTYTAQGTYTIHWNYTDASGNTSSQTQTVIIKDVTAPVVPVLATVTGQCSATAPVPTTSDNCGGTVTGTTTDARTYSTQGTYLIHWTFNDGNGNTSTAIQTVIVKDVTAPVLPVLATVTGECSATASVPTTTDNCSGTITGSTTDAISYSTQGTYTIHWSFDDGNGNISVAAQTVIVKDVTAPVVPVLVTVTGECSATVPVPTTTDNCSGTVTGTTTDALSYSAQGTYTIHWKFDDGNGNILVATQTVVVKDVTAPVVPVLATVTGECSATVPVPTTTDNCSGTVTGTTTDALSYSAQGTYTIHWSFDDGNGNISVATQTVVVKDVTAPVVPVLATITGECSATATVPTTTDNCSGTVTGTTTDGLSYSAQGTYTIHWSFDDGNGNISVATQTVVVKDVTAPVVPVLATITGECSATATVPTTTDNCAGTVTGTTTDPLTYSTQGTHTIHWTFDDGNGNTSTATQTVIVKDVTAPVVPVLATVTGECSATAPVPTTTDNCAGTVTGTTTDPVSYSAQGTYTIHWIFNDGNGNTSTATQTVIVKDVTKPILSAAPSNVTVECNAVPVAAILTATDNCSAATVVMTETRANGNCSGNYILTRTWTASDANGNSCSKTQVITVQDTQKPILSAAPANVTVECNAVPAAATLTATDNCSTPVVTYNEVRTYGLCAGNYTLTRTWTATDACGNSCSKTQVITVRDTQAPILSAAPANVTVECNAVPAAAILTATDNCTTPVVGYTEVRTNGNCSGNYTLTRTWTATDACGNTSSKTQVITVQDTQAPVLSAAPANTTVECNAIPAAAVLTATDNCATPTVVYTETSTQNANPNTAGYYNYTLTRKWTATDACGNSSGKTQVITVQDTQQPIVVCPVVAASCNNQVGNSKTVTLTATDNCGPVTVSYTLSGATVFTGGTGATLTKNFNVGTTQINWTVKDATGNTSTCTTTVVINALPVAGITASSADAFCNNFVLTGNSTLNGPFTYQWLFNNQTNCSTQQLTLGLTNPDGVYTLYTTDGNGCRSAAGATYNYQKQNLVNSYTILTYKDANIGKYNKVLSGSIGVMTSSGDADFKSYSSVTGAGSFVKAPQIDKNGSGIVINSQIIGIAAPSLPVMQYNTAITKGLPNYTVAQYTTITVNGNYDKLTVKRGANVTITGNIFGTVNLEYGASIKFTSTNLSIESLLVDDGAKDNFYSYIRFAANSSVKISNKVSIGSQVRLNPENNKVTIYMGDLKSDEEKFTVKGGDTRVIANIMMPNGKLRVTATDSDDDDHDNCDHHAHSSWLCKHRNHGHNACNHGAHNASDCTDDVYMTGLFIVESLDSKGNTVIWNSYDCAAPSNNIVLNTATPPVQTATSETKTTATTEVSVTEEELKVTVMPNPSTTFFTLKLESKYETPVNMRVMDGRGRVIDAKSKIGANSTIQIGHNYSSGTYYAELIQGTKRKVVQLIKAKG